VRHMGALVQYIEAQIKTDRIVELERAVVHEVIVHEIGDEGLERCLQALRDEEEGRKYDKLAHVYYWTCFTRVEKEAFVRVQNTL
jgi:hypothetical protein